MSGAVSPRVSLLVGTAGRVDELDRLLASLALQTFRDFRVLVLDQNADDRLDALLARFAGRLALERLRLPPGLSPAHNAGLRAASSDLVGFPDDDCRYPPDLLADLVARFDAQPTWGGITVRCLDDEGRPSAAKWDAKPGRLTKLNAGFRGVSTSMFFRRSAIDRIGPFDARFSIGGGATLGHGDADYLLRAVAAGVHVHYAPELHVLHPQLFDLDPSSPRALSKRAAYGFGFGALMRAHRLPAWYAAGAVAAPLARAAAAALRGRALDARGEWATASGRARGLLGRP